jgi:hypothetical protein
MGVWYRAGFRRAGSDVTKLARIRLDRFRSQTPRSRGAGNNASGSEYQTVSIPTSAAANLTFWLNITTSEACCTAFDFVYAEVKSTSGALLGTLGTWTNANSGTAGVYSQKSSSLASSRGQTVRVQFRATTDISLPTSFRINDVSLR